MTTLMITLPHGNKVQSRAELKEFQRQMAEMLFQPLTTSWKMRKKTKKGDDMTRIASAFIKPNDRLSSFERIEIYSRSYWFRVLDSLYDDFPGLLSLLGNRKFLKLATDYLIRYPSESFTLRNLGSRLEAFLATAPEYTAPLQEVACDMVRFEWAQIVAFDGPSRKSITPREIQKKNPATLATLRLGLQPYLSLLELDHAVDHYLIAVKNQEADALRHETSNTSSESPEQKSRSKRLALPKKEKVYLAVHRYDNTLYTKRLEPSAFTLLSALSSGATLEEACETALSVAVLEKKNAGNFQQQLSEWFADWSSLGWFILPNSHKTNS